MQSDHQNIKMEKQARDKQQEDDSSLPLECTADGSVCVVRPGSADHEEESSPTETRKLTTTTSDTTDDDKNGKETAPSQEFGEPSTSTTRKKVTESRTAVRTLHSQSDLNTLLASSSSQHATIIVEFVTTWCGACKSIATQFLDLAKKYANDDIICATVVCDKNKTTQKLAAEYNVGSYPVFIARHHRQQVQKWNGADQGKLVKVFEKYASSNGGKKGGGKGRGGGGKTKGRR